MKRLTLPARYRAANKAQENPYGAVVVTLLFLGAILLSASPVFARSTAQNKPFATIDAPRELYAQNKQPYQLIADVKRTKKIP